MASSLGFDKVSLVADEETDAIGYWQTKHGFNSPNPEREMYLEKRI